MEKKHKFAYNDIDQPWQPISDGDSAEDDSHEIVLKQNDFVSVQPLVKDEVKQVSESPVVVADETPVTPVVKAEDTPAVPITKAEEALVVAPVVEAEKEQQVADAISLIVTAVAEDEVATTTHEKLLADIEDIVPATTTNEKLLADIEDNVPATTTHEKLLGVADEVEGSGQSDPVVEQESVTISQPNEPVEDSTFSAFKTDLVEESVTKVADESDTNEGSGQLLSDSADEGSGQPLSDSADEGSGQPLKDFAGEGSGQPLADIPSSDEGSGAADTTEESGLAGELIKEIEHTIQPEISNEESSTGTHSDVHLKDDLAFDSLTTTESSTTDLVDEKEVKSTDTPTADDEVYIIIITLRLLFAQIFKQLLCYVSGYTDRDSTKLDDKKHSGGGFHRSGK